MWARRFMATVLVLAAGCDFGPGAVAPVAASGELVVVTVNGPATYYEDAEGHATGLEHDLATLFARELGVRPRFILAKDRAHLDQVIRRGAAHIAAAALARSTEAPEGAHWGPAFFTAQQQVIHRAADPRPRALADLEGKRIGVLDTSASDAIYSEPPRLALPIERMPPGTSVAELLERLVDGRLDFAVVESLRFTLHRKHFPQLEAAFAIGIPVQYAWLVAPIDASRILAAARPFFDRITRDGTFARLVDRYLGHAARITAVDAETLLERIGTVLPHLTPHLHEAEVLTGLDWRLIAAIGYQESHWNASATSPTGVRGLMMLTEETAERLKVKNRLDARESILGGARYLALLRDALAPRIREPDRTLLALAAYNLGLGHLEDARILAQRSGLNPDLWQDVRQVLGRLADPAVYGTLKHGFARGHEARQFVDNVRNYHDMLDRLAPRAAPLMPRPAPAPQSSSNASTSPR